MGSPSGFTYDVFLSFRGEDTRKNFTDHLHKTLLDARFRTFLDDDKLPRGENIKEELEKAIRESRSSVIVFSEDYASSKWCLDELVIILERRRTFNHFVLPVFYHVDPSHLRKQTGNVAEAFIEHQKTQSSEKLNGWRSTMPYFQILIMGLSQCKIMTLAHNHTVIMPQSQLWILTQRKITTLPND